MTIILLLLAWFSLSIGLALWLGPALKKDRLEQTAPPENGEHT
jgi:hypothetical protein